MVDFSKIDLNQLRMACCTEEGKLSEPKIADLLIENSGMVSLHGVPYGADGEISESALTRPLAEVLVALGERSGVANKVLSVKEKGCMGYRDSMVHEHNHQSYRSAVPNCH